jgi:hypothetical protein
VLTSKENDDFILQNYEIDTTDVIIQNVMTGENKIIFTRTSAYYYSVKEIVNESL